MELLDPTTLDPATIQTGFALLIAVGIQFFKRWIPTLDGHAAFWAGLGLNLLVATANYIGVDPDMGLLELLRLGIAGGAGSVFAYEAGRRTGVVKRPRSSSKVGYGSG